MSEEVFYSEQHEGLDRHIKVSYDSDKGQYHISGLAGEDAVTVDENELGEDPSLSDYRTALEQDTSSGPDWSNDGLDNLILSYFLLLFPYLL